MLKIILLLEGNIIKSLYSYDMEDLIRELVFMSKTASIANKIDVSESVLEVSENLSLVKQAQYLGIQGDWIRNGRCFANCIRMKKSSNPDLRDQEIWSECHEEWMNGMFGSENDSFDKYASSDLNYKNQVKSKIEQGMSLEEASWKSVVEQNFSIAHEISRNAKIIRAASQNVSYSDNSSLRADLVKVARQLDILAEKEFKYVINEIFNKGNQEINN